MATADQSMMVDDVADGDYLVEGPGAGGYIERIGYVHMDGVRMVRAIMEDGSVRAWSCGVMVTVNAI